MSTATATDLQQRYDLLRKRFHGAVLVMQAVRAESDAIEEEADKAGIRLDAVGSYRKALPAPNNDLLSGWLAHERANGRIS